ncbi:MAG: hypothetical protein OHK0037_05070 [Elainellaceae cyanobacterium]
MDTPPAPDATPVQQQCASLLKDFWQAKYAAYQSGEDAAEEMPLRQNAILPGNASAIAGIGIAGAPPLPANVQAAYDFYHENVMQHDWGSVSVSQMPMEGAPDGAVYAVVTTTDGDDGWLELFDLDGNPLGAARTYLELVSWGDPEVLREQVHTGAFPEELETRMDTTLWGK